jgi:hypothetical protein
VRPSFKSGAALSQGGLGPESLTTKTFDHDDSNASPFAIVIHLAQLTHDRHSTWPNKANRKKNAHFERNKDEGRNIELEKDDTIVSAFMCAAFQVPVVVTVEPGR